MGYRQRGPFFWASQARGSQSVLLAAAVVTVAAAMALNSPAVGASSTVKNRSIKVVSPMSLRQTRDASIFNFSTSSSSSSGFFNGGVTVGSLAYPSSKLNRKGCRPFDEDKTFKSTSSLPTILLLDRGDCFLALKVWNGQQAGAAAVLVADDINEPLFNMSDYPIHTSYKIGIWSALIERSFGDVLKHALTEGSHVFIDWEPQTYPLKPEIII